MTGSPAKSFARFTVLLAASLSACWCWEGPRLGADPPQVQKPFALPAGQGSLAAGIISVGGSGAVLDYTGLVTSVSRVVPAGADRVLTKRGDRFVGRVVGLTNDGILRFASPQFDGEVRVKASEVASLELSAGQPSTAPDTVVITNGDRLAGRVTGITADSVMLDSDAAGPGVKISRKVVQTIAFGQSGACLSECNFASGNMEPWKAVNGQWKVEGGSLVCGAAPGSLNLVKAPLQQDGPVAIEITADLGGGQTMWLFAGLLLGEADTADTLKDDVFCRLEHTELNMGFDVGGNPTHVITERTVTIPQRNPFVMRFAFDPASGKGKCWINGAQMAECDMKGKAPVKGKWVAVGTHDPCKIKSIRVTGGESIPGEVSDAKSEADMVQFANNDHVSAKSLMLADGQLHVETAFGELACPAGKVGSIVFDSGSRATPKLLKNQGTVQTSAGNLTVQVDTLDEQSLTGRCDYLGPVTIRRGAIKGIQFSPPPPGEGRERGIPTNAD